MPRISQLPAKTTPASGDEIAIVEVATSTTKKITRADLLKGADLPNDTVTTGAIKNGAVTTDKIADKAVTADKIDFTTLAFGNYSTTEVDTGFKWIDGKAIYKRTFTGVITIAANSRASTSLASGIANVLRYEGEVYEVSGGTRMILPSQWINITNSNQGSGYVILDSSGNVSLLTLMPSGRTNAPYAVTLYYTKV